MALLNNPADASVLPHSALLLHRMLRLLRFLLLEQVRLLRDHRSCDFCYGLFVAADLLHYLLLVQVRLLHLLCPWGLLFVLFYYEFIEFLGELFVTDPFFYCGVFGLCESRLWVCGFGGIAARLQKFLLFCINRSHSQIVLGDNFSVFESLRAVLHNFGDDLLSAQIIGQFFGYVQFQITHSVHVFIDLLRFPTVSLGQLLDFLEFGEDTGLGTGGLQSGQDIQSRRFGQFEQLNAEGVRLFAAELAGELGVKGAAQVFGLQSVQCIVHFYCKKIISHFIWVDKQQSPSIIEAYHKSILPRFPDSFSERIYLRRGKASPVRLRRR